MCGATIPFAISWPRFRRSTALYLYPPFAATTHPRASFYAPRYGSSPIIDYDGA